MHVRRYFESTKVLSKVLSYESTKVFYPSKVSVVMYHIVVALRVYSCTEVRKYFRKYFRTKYEVLSYFIFTSGNRILYSYFRTSVSYGSIILPEVLSYLRSTFVSISGSTEVRKYFRMYFRKSLRRYSNSRT